MGNTEMLEAIPKPPEGATFNLRSIQKISHPHPFCITPRHVAYASDHHGGILDESAIRQSEAPCGVKGCQIEFSEHKTDLSLIIEVDDNRDLNRVEGLIEYLKAIKDKLAELGIEGIAFPRRGQHG